MKMSELKKKKDSELLKLLREKRSEMCAHRFEAATAQGNVNARAGIRKDVARILTELGARTS